jgi:hypothetical protein
MKHVKLFEAFLNESFSRPSMVAAVNTNTDFDEYTDEPEANDIELAVVKKKRKNALNYAVKPSDKFVVVHSTRGDNGDIISNEFPDDFRIFGSSATSLDDVKKEILKSLKDSGRMDPEPMDDMVEILDLSTGKKHDFDGEIIGKMQ